MSLKPDKETLLRWHKDPSNWKWGMIYYNKEDKRLFPPKRIPIMGWTINFANKWSVVAMVVLILAIIGLMKFIVIAGI